MAGVATAKYVTDDVGTRIGVLTGIDDYHKILEDEGELESIRAYDVAKTSGDEAIPFEQAVKEIESGSGMSHRIFIQRRAQKELSRIPNRSFGRIKESIIRLGEDPLPRGCKKLTGRDASLHSPSSIPQVNAHVRS